MVIEATGSAATDELLEHHRQQLETKLWPKIRMYEAQYALASDQLSSALECGQLVDTDEICDWLIAWETLRAITAVGSARLE